MSALRLPYQIGMLLYGAARGLVSGSVSRVYTPLEAEEKAEEETPAPGRPKLGESAVEKEERLSSMRHVAEMCTKVSDHLMATAGDSSGANEERYRAKQAREIAQVQQKLDAQDAKLDTKLDAQDTKLDEVKQQVEAIKQQQEEILQLLRAKPQLTA